MRQRARTRRLPALAFIAVLLALLPHSMQASSAIIHAESVDRHLAAPSRSLSDDLQSKVGTIITSDTAAGSSWDADEVFCPQGMIALGGGVDVGDAFNMTVSTNGPTVDKKRMLTIGGGTHGAANGWFGGALNATEPGKPYKLGAVCAPTTGTSTVVVSSTTSGGSGQTSLTCPAGTVTLGGGVDVDNVALMNTSSSGPTFAGTPPHQMAAGTYGAPDGWTGSASSVSDRDFYVGAVCGPMKGIQSVVVDDRVFGGANINVEAACPTGTIAIGGGVTTDDVVSSAVTASGPAFGDTLHGILIEPDGWGAAPIGWEADVRNDGAGQVIVAVVAICAHWPMQYFKGNEAPAPGPPPY
jgi:hypothetical protein